MPTIEKELLDAGVKYLGGCKGDGVFLEVEYVDFEGKYIEGVFKIQSRYANSTPKKASLIDETYLTFDLDGEHFQIHLAGKCSSLTAVRRPMGFNDEDNDITYCFLKGISVD